MLSATAALAAILVPIRAPSQTHSGFPIDVTAGPSPQPVMAYGQRHLLYELHVTNFAPLPIEMTRLEIRGDGAAPLASYEGAVLADMVVPVEELSSAGSPAEDKGNRTIGAGHAVMIFLDVLLNPDLPVPRELGHKFFLSVTPKGQPSFEKMLEGPSVAVNTNPVPVLLNPPLRGSSWVALSSLGGKDHRRSLNAVDGRERIPQRFAIDWVRLGADGRLLRGKGKSNADYYSYGAEVIAVADGRIADARDGIPDNGGTTERSARHITLENVFGNYLVQEVGNGRFAVYAHLQPGSLKVKAGDSVRAGETLALLGNSGNSDGPHLHFQVVDGPSPMASEGMPYEIVSFTQRGTITDVSGVMDEGHAWQPGASDVPSTRHNEFPINDAVVNFP